PRPAPEGVQLALDGEAASVAPFRGLPDHIARRVVRVLDGRVRARDTGHAPIGIPLEDVLTAIVIHDARHTPDCVPLDLRALPRAVLEGAEPAHGVVGVAMPAPVEGGLPHDQARVIVLEGAGLTELVGDPDQPAFAVVAVLDGRAVWQRLSTTPVVAAPLEAREPSSLVLNRGHVPESVIRVVDRRAVRLDELSDPPRVRVPVLGR